MKITYKNISIETLKENEIENLRLLRNKYADFLINTNLISIKQQLHWFKNDAHKSMYYSVFYNLELAGFIFAKDLKSDEKCFTTGILFFEKHQNTSTPTIASLLLTHFLFNILHYQTAKAVVSKKNTEAINFNQQFGFEKVNYKDEFIYFELKKENFHSKLGSLLNNVLKSTSISIPDGKFSKLIAK